MDSTGISQLWRVVDPLSVNQASALINGVDPSTVHEREDGELCFRDAANGSSVIHDVRTVRTALASAIDARQLKATIRRPAWQRGYAEEPRENEWLTHNVAVLPKDASEAYQVDPYRATVAGVIFRTIPDWALTTVAVSDLKAWLVAHDLRPRFFFPEDPTPEPDAKSGPDILDPAHPRHCPTLAAANRVWYAMEDPCEWAGKGPVVANTAWLTVRYKELGLVHDKDNPKNKTKAGDPNKSAISEAAKIANWNPRGGAPKTPGK